MTRAALALGECRPRQRLPGRIEHVIGRDPGTRARLLVVVDADDSTERVDVAQQVQAALEWNGDRADRELRDLFGRVQERLIAGGTARRRAEVSLPGGGDELALVGSPPGLYPETVTV